MIYCMDIMQILQEQDKSHALFPPLISGPKPPGKKMPLGQKPPDKNIYVHSYSVNQKHLCLIVSIVINQKLYFIDKQFAFVTFEIIKSNDFVIFGFCLIIYFYDFFLYFKIKTTLFLKRVITILNQIFQLFMIPSCSNYTYL